MRLWGVEIACRWLNLDGLRRRPRRLTQSFLTGYQRDSSRRSAERERFEGFNNRRWIGYVRLTDMYSPNAAYEAGRKIGRRHPDVWVTEDDLVALISREILPQVRPRNPRLTREADHVFSMAVVFTVLAAASVALRVAINDFSDEVS